MRLYKGVWVYVTFKYQGYEFGHCVVLVHLAVGTAYFEFSDV